MHRYLENDDIQSIELVNDSLKKCRPKLFDQRFIKKKNIEEIKKLKGDNIIKMFGLIIIK
jgi:hypothetical protein